MMFDTARTKMSLLTTAAALTTALAVSACGSSREAEQKPASAPPLAVASEPASMTEIAERLEAGGVVRAVSSATVASRVMATVLERRVSAGEHVSRGQVLIVLDDRDLAAQVRQASASSAAAEQAVTSARSELEAATAEQRLATAWHQRIASLRASNAATAQELDEADARLAAADARLAGLRARVEQATAALEAARAAGEVATTTRSFAELLAPFDGTVAETLIEAGSLATPGQTLVRLDADGAREVEVRVDEARVPYVRIGNEVEVVLDAPAAQAVTARVTEVARAVESSARTFAVKVTLPATVVPRVGSFARVRFAGPTHQALTVPVGAVRRQGQLTTAFVVDGELARMRMLRTGLIDGERVEVLAGLDQGERVVVSPPPQLADGTPITASGSAR